MTKRLLIFLLFAIPVAGIAQQQTQLPMPEVPLTPEAAAFAKYGDVPINYSSGTTNISVPIYDLKLKNYTVPIRLSYHSGGFKVDELSSDVGLGWTLDGFGMISQNVRGLRDYFDGSSGYATRSEIISLIDSDNQVTGTGYYVCETQDDCSTNQLSRIGHKPDNQDDVLYGRVDAEPDIFNFNIPGLSGKAFINKSGDFVTNRAGKIKIEYISGTDRFVISDESGIAYTFAEKEILTTVNSCNSPSIYDTNRRLENYSPNYYLTSICLPDGGCINYEYQDYSYTYHTGITQTGYHNISAGSPKGVSTCFTEITITQGKKLSRISTDHGIEVLFDYEGTQRGDLPNALNGMVSGKLESITVNAAGEQVTQFTLDQNYTNGLLNPHIWQLTGISGERSNARLMLRSVQQSGKSPYSFEYASDTDWGSYTLPDRFSFAKDHWGYYNGQDTNSDLLPPILLNVGSAIKDPSANHMQANILRKMIYPTGGYTSFDYEPHQREIVSTDPSECTQTIENRSVTLVSQGNQGPRSRFFEITEDSYDIRVNYTTNVPVENTEQFIPVHNEPFSQCYINNTGLIFTFPQTGALNIPVGNQELVLWTANDIGIRGEDQNPIPSETSITISWKEPVWNCTDPTTNRQIVLYGGLRIKRIADSPDGEADPIFLQGPEVVFRSFEYRWSHVNNNIYRSSNKVDGSYYTFNTYVPKAPISDEAGCIGTDPYFNGTGIGYGLYRSVSSESRRNLGYSTGGNMLYSQVTETLDPGPDLLSIPGGASNNNGRTVYYFSIYDNIKSDNNGVYVEHDYSWLNGDISYIEEQRYNPSAEDYTRIKSTRYNYTVHDLNFSGSDRNYEEIWAWKASQTHPAFRFYLGANSCGSVVPRYTSNFYKIPSIWKTLDRVLETHYDRGGINTIETYTYNNVSMQRASQSVKVDDLKSSKTYTFTANDLVGKSPIYSTMIAENMYNKPVYIINAVERIIDPNEELSGAVEEVVNITRLNYVQQGNFIRLGSITTSEFEEPIELSGDFAGALTPDRADNLLSGNSSEARVTYDNTFGNVIQVEQRGKIKSFIWDSNHLYLLAEVVNSGDLQVYHTSFETTGTPGISKTGDKYLNSGSFTIPKTLLNINLKMSYWYWQNGEWKFSGELDFNPNINSPGSRLDEIRVYPIYSLMSTYTHKPGVGITSDTDPNGFTTHYSYYPNANWLESVIDTDGNLLQLIEYNFAN